MLPTIPSNGREHAGEGKIALRHLQGGHELVALARGLVFLGLEHIEIGLGAFKRGGCRRLGGVAGGERRDRAVAVGGRLFEPLLGAEIRLRELIRAVIFESGTLNVGLGAPHLRGRGGDLRLSLGDDRRLCVDLPGEAGDGRVLGADARPRCVDGVLIVAVVDRGEQVALVHDLVVDHRNRGQMPHGLGGDDRGVGADIGVVGRDEETPLDEIVVGRFAAIAERGENQDRNDEPAQAGSLRWNGHGGRRAARGRAHESAGRTGRGGRKAAGRGGRHRAGRNPRTWLRDLGVIDHVRNPPSTKLTERFGHFG